ncbi:MAG TPA: spermidine synthase, partial [Prochlorococcus sp.]
VLLLGAGDGLALREVLRWPSVERIDLIELDKAILTMAQEHPALQRLNQNSFADPRVHVQVGDAFGLISEMPGPFDVVIADFPDPDTAAVARLYSVGFYNRLIKQLDSDGVFVTQASTPFFTPLVLASIEKSLQHLPVQTHPYSVTVPSFGPWGFVLAHRESQQLAFQAVPFEAKWFDHAQLTRMLEFPRDYRPSDQDSVQANRLTRPILIDYQRRDRWSAPIR